MISWKGSGKVKASRLQVSDFYATSPATWPEHDGWGAQRHPLTLPCLTAEQPCQLHFDLVSHGAHHRSVCSVVLRNLYITHQTTNVLVKYSKALPFSTRVILLKQTTKQLKYAVTNERVPVLDNTWYEYMGTILYELFYPILAVSHGFNPDRVIFLICPDNKEWKDSIKSSNVIIICVDTFLCLIHFYLCRQIDKNT